MPTGSKEDAEKILKYLKQDREDVDTVVLNNLAKPLSSELKKAVGEFCDHIDNERKLKLKIVSMGTRSEDVKAQTERLKNYQDIISQCHKSAISAVETYASGKPLPKPAQSASEPHPLSALSPEELKESGEPYWIPKQYLPALDVLKTYTPEQLTSMLAALSILSKGSYVTPETLEQFKEEVGDTLDALTTIFKIKPGDLEAKVKAINDFDPKNLEQFTKENLNRTRAAISVLSKISQEKLTAYLTTLEQLGEFNPEELKRLRALKGLLAGLDVTALEEDVKLWKTAEPMIDELVDFAASSTLDPEVLKKYLQLARAVGKVPEKTLDVFMELAEKGLLQKFIQDYAATRQTIDKIKISTDTFYTYLQDKMAEALKVSLLTEGGMKELAQYVLNGFQVILTDGTESGKDSIEVRYRAVDAIPPILESVVNQKGKFVFANGIDKGKPVSDEVQVTLEAALEGYKLAQEKIEQFFKVPEVELEEEVEVKAETPQIKPISIADLMPTLRQLAEYEKLPGIEAYTNISNKDGKFYGIKTDGTIDELATIAAESAKAVFEGKIKAPEEPKLDIRHEFVSGMLCFSPQIKLTVEGIKYKMLIDKKSKSPDYNAIPSKFREQVQKYFEGIDATKLKEYLSKF